MMIFEIYKPRPVPFIDLVTEETLLQLKSMNCYAGQGFLFAKPMPANAIDDWYEQWPAQWRQLTNQARRAVI